MEARTLRILLIAGATSVIASWLFDVVGAGIQAGPAAIAGLLVILAAAAIVVTVRREKRSNGRPRRSADESLG